MSAVGGEANGILSSREFILHPDGSDSSRCSYAIFLLNKVSFCLHPDCLFRAYSRETGPKVLFDCCGNKPCLHASMLGRCGEGTFDFGVLELFLLKDIEQLLECHGLTSAGPSLVLQNLYKLLTAALSTLVPRQHWHK